MGIIGAYLLGSLSCISVGHLPYALPGLISTLLDPGFCLAKLFSMGYISVLLGLRSPLDLANKEPQEEPQDGRGVREGCLISWLPPC